MLQMLSSQLFFYITTLPVLIVNRITCIHVKDRRLRAVKRLVLAPVFQDGRTRLRTPKDQNLELNFNKSVIRI